MNENDTKRATRVASIICDDRDPRDPANQAAIMVTLEHAVSTVLLAIYGTPHMAANMLNEALVPGIEERFAFCVAKETKR
jgi:hypothetical protein